VYHGDLFEVLPEFERDSIDVCVTDPPYGLGFMGKEWDQLTSKQKVSAMKQQQHWHQAWAEEVWRVLKPGAHLLAFGGTRTFHRLTCALEDADFEIRDCLMWLYGTGFPKSLNVQQAINKAQEGFPQGGPDPTSPNHGKFKGGCTDDSPTGQGFGAGAGSFMDEQGNGRGNDEGPWQGWGTALKPAWEPIILARKPLSGTVAENVLTYGTGALNIDACRIETQDNLNGGAYSGGKRTPVSGEERSAVAAGMYGEDGRLTPEQYTQPQGRWPANVILDEEAALQLNAQAGERVSPWIGNANGHTRGAKGGLMFGGTEQRTEHKTGYLDSGGASRFFYCAKPGRSERDIGCEDLPIRTGGEATDRVDGTDGLNSPRAGSGRTGGARNTHPTVKPLSLMRWLIRLVTPPGGVVLDPFLGSGTTAMACIPEHCGYIGIEKEKESFIIAEHRIAGMMQRQAQKKLIVRRTEEDVPLPF
jgi:site-specific DNA-methyltransferase (adenine-specific)